MIFRVARHHPQPPGFADGSDPGWHKVLAQGTVRQLNRSPLQPTRGFALGGKIRQHRDHLVRGGDVGTLRGPHDGFAHAHVKVRIFGVGFLVSAHAWIAIHFHHQGGKHVDPHRSRLRRIRRVNRLDQVHVEGTAHRQALRENRAARKHNAMRPFFILHHRYFQARLGERDFLQFVEVFRLLACTFVENLTGDAEKTAGRTDFLGIRSSREFLARLHFRGNV